MGQTFLDQFVRLLLDRHGTDFGHVAVVLPSLRAGRYFRKSLSSACGKAVIAPELHTLPSYVARVMSRAQATRTEALCALYVAYGSVSDRRESFSAFLKWGSSALDDFNDIDQALADPDRVFRQLTEIREIEGWSFGESPLSASQQEYAGFWKMLGNLYREWKDLPDRLPLYAELIRELATERASWQHKAPGFTWFAGLSSLTRAEERWVDYLVEEGRAACYWDADEWYMRSRGHEAGHWLRKRPEGEWSGVLAGIGNPDKRIELHECTTSFGQIWAAGEVLGSMSPAQLERTAVVLADNHLVWPLVQSLPPLPVPVNVAIGAPVHLFRGYKWVHALLEVQREWSEQDGRGILRETVERVLAACPDPGVGSRALSALQSELPGRRYVDEAFIRAWMALPEEWRKWLVPVEGIPEFVSALLSGLEEWQCSPAADDPSAEVSGRLARTWRTIANFAGKHAFLRNWQALEALANQLGHAETIPFEDASVNGLQVLTMVETRAIDFDCVIILGANDDLLPGVVAGHSLIPMDLRRIHGLPLPEDRECAYSYTFYRLIQRCSHLHLLYASIIADFRGSEPSRYISQLQIEWPAATGASIHTRRVVSPMPGPSPRERAVQGSGFAALRIRERLERGISPSAIGAWLSCPLDFYYRYVLGIREPQEDEAHFNQAQFGEIAHDVLEVFMKDFMGAFPGPGDWKAFRESLAGRIETSARRKFPQHVLNSGYNVVQARILRGMLARWSEMEQEWHAKFGDGGVSHSVEALESEWVADVPGSEEALGFVMRLKGKADRIDRVGGVRRIIDYKTGEVRRSGIRDNKDWFTAEYDKVVQIMTYAAIFQWRDATEPAPDAMLVSLRDPANGILLLSDATRDVPGWMEQFRQRLVSMAGDMLKTETFIHNTSARYCAYCTD